MVKRTDLCIKIDRLISRAWQIKTRQQQTAFELSFIKHSSKDTQKLLREVEKP